MLLRYKKKDSSNRIEAIMDKNLSKARLFAGLILPTSTFFCGWAIQNTLERGSLDLGVVSFATVMLSSMFLLTRTPALLPIKKRDAVIILVSYVFVIINYALGAWIGYTIFEDISNIFVIYCITFVFVWGFLGFIMWKLLSGLTVT